MKRGGKRAQAELTFEVLGTIVGRGPMGPTRWEIKGLPVSCCQKCTRPGAIASCERKRLVEEYTFTCDRCQRKWIIAL